MRTLGQKSAFIVLQRCLAFWNWVRSPEVPAGPSFPRSAAYLALTQGNGREFLGELHLFSKLVKVGSRVSAWGQHKHQGDGGTGVPEHDGEVSGLQQRQLVTVEGCASGLHIGTMHSTTSPNWTSSPPCATGVVLETRSQKHVP